MAEKQKEHITVFFIASYNISKDDILEEWNSNTYDDKSITQLGIIETAKDLAIQKLETDLSINDELEVTFDIRTNIYNLS